MRLQESLHEQQEPCDKRWPRKLQWPSQKYLHTCWVQTCQMLQQPDPKQPPGEVKVPLTPSPQGALCPPYQDCAPAIR